MTLNLTFASTRYVHQVTDRLLTCVGVCVDPLANKNVIYWARDAIVTLGYTGLAYLEGIPTDQWLAESLADFTFDRSGRFRTFIRCGPLPQWRDIGLSVKCLCEKLQTALKRARSETFEIIIAGWQWGRRERTRPIIWSVSYPDGKGGAETTRLPRRWYMPMRTKLGATPGGNISDQDFREVAARLPAQSADEVEAALVHGIRLTANKNCLVGPHCISIGLPDPKRRLEVRVRYIPLGFQTAVVTGGGRTLEVPAAFSPWVVGQSLIAPPLILVGGRTELHMGPFTVLLEAPDNVSKVWAMSSNYKPSSGA